jgi:hypothetical protein
VPGVDLVATIPGVLEAAQQRHVVQRHSASQFPAQKQCLIGLSITPG